jgi:hypothetical protein
VTAARLANLGTRQLLGTASAVEDKELRCHVGQMLPHLKVTPNEQKVVLQILMGYLEDGSSIVKTFSMQALAELAMQDGRLLALVTPLIEQLTRTGTRAMKSRCRKLLKKLKPLRGSE